MHDVAIRSRWSWGLVGAVAALGAISALYVAVTPAGDQTPLANRTWEQLAAADAEVASIVSRLLVVLGLLGVAFGTLSLVVALVPYRLGARWAWYALLLMPITYGAIGARQLSDQYPIGYFYGALAAVAAIALLLEIPRIRRQPAVESGQRPGG
jgi:hypothetical protein